MLRQYYYALNPGGQTGTACNFTPFSNSTSNASSYQEQDNITGAANAVVTCQVTTYTVTNASGAVKVNGTQVYLNSTFTVTLNASGVGNFTTQLTGDPSNTGSVVRVVISIQSVSVGQIGSPSTVQVSKTF